MNSVYFKTEDLTSQQIQDGLDRLVELGGEPFESVASTVTAFKYSEDEAYNYDFEYAGLDSKGLTRLEHGSGDFGKDAKLINYPCHLTLDEAIKKLDDIQGMNYIWLPVDDAVELAGTFTVEELKQIVSILEQVDNE